MLVVAADVQFPSEGGDEGQAAAVGVVLVGVLDVWRVARSAGVGDGDQDGLRRAGNREAEGFALVAAGAVQLVTRNVASLVEPPRVVSRELSPWTLDETLTFLAAARKDRLYAAFVLAVTMGLRRGEIVGLRWSDVDLDNRVLRVRQQTQRRQGRLYEDDPKGRRRRVVPLPAMCVAPLRWHRMRQAAARNAAGERWQESDYVFTTRSGRPVEPRNVYRSFTRVAKDAGLRFVRLHDARHGCATLLVAAGVAPRVVMEILGHSQISITMDVYTHVVEDTQREAISHMGRLLKRRPGS